MIAADVLMPDHETARYDGEIAAQLARDGSPIPQNDIWIAAIAIQNDLALVTRDNHFNEIEGLSLIAW